MVQKQFFVSALFCFGFFTPIVLTSPIGVTPESVACTSPECFLAIQKAEEIKKYRNESINPCDNLYQHVCGNYRGPSSVDKYEKSIDEANKRVKLLIKETSMKSDDFKPIKLIRDVFQTCIRNDTVPISADLLSKTIKNMTPKMDWVDITIELQNIGMNIKYLDIEPMGTLEGDSMKMEYILTIPPAVSRKTSFDSKDPLTSEYSSYVKRIAEMVGVTIDLSEVWHIHEFEQKIREIVFRSNDGPYLTQTTVEELIKQYPSVNWDKLLTNILLQHIKPATKLSDLKLLITSSFSDYMDLLEKTPQDLKFKYTLWKMIQNTLPFLDNDIYERGFDFCRITGYCNNKTREDACLDVVETYLKPAVNLLFAKKYYNRDIDTQAHNLVVKVKDQFIQLINQSTWLDQQAKANGIEIIKSTTFVIGYDAKDKSDEDYIKFYEDLEIDTDNFLQTLINLEKFDIKHRFNNVSSIGRKESKDPLKTTRAMNVRGNIYVPMAALQKHSFNINDPMYGLISPSIAYELTRNILHLGRSFEDGKEVDNAVTSCFRRQLEPLKKSKSRLGQISIDDEILMQMSAKIAYLVYQHSVTGKETPFPGLKYSTNQLFWVNIMTDLCSYDSTMSKVVGNKYYDFEYYILKNILSVDQFWEDFGCKMNQSRFIKDYGESCPYL